MPPAVLLSFAAQKRCYLHICVLLAHFNSLAEYRQIAQLWSVTIQMHHDERLSRSCALSFLRKDAGPGRRSDVSQLTDLVGRLRVGPTQRQTLQRPL